MKHLMERIFQYQQQLHQANEVVNTPKEIQLRQEQQAQLPQGRQCQISYVSSLCPKDDMFGPSKQIQAHLAPGAGSG
jgi:hypothetical protein